jgi:guanylate kinase
MAESYEPLVLIVSGPSGSGKSTLVRRLLQLPGMLWSISCTTRKPRDGENEKDRWYNFVTEAEFQEMVNKGEFLEYAQVFGKNWYGTPRRWVDEARDKEQDLLLEIDVEGTRQVKGKLPGAIAIFVVPPSRSELEKRLRARGQDTDEEIQRRLLKAKDEMEHFVHYDYVVINDDVERAGREIQAIALGARCLTQRKQATVQRILESFGG